jgi:hypothetical protein
MRLTGREAELHRKTIGVHDGVNLAGKSNPRRGLSGFHLHLDQGHTCELLGEQLTIVPRWQEDC